MRPLLLPLLLCAACLPGAPSEARGAPAERAVAASPLDPDRLAAGVATHLSGDLSAAEDFSTGAALFDQEWSFGARQMAALGFAQRAVATSDPAARAEAIAQLEHALDGLLSDEGRRFDAGQWGEDPLVALPGDRGHIAWLGYTNLALSAHRALVHESRFTAMNDAITDAIARRVAADPLGLPETYAGERYVVDVSAAVASVEMYDRAVGVEPRGWVAAWKERVRSRWVVDGLVVQAVRPDGAPRDRPRGSGTFLASWFWSWADPAFAAELYRGGRAALYQDLGFAGAMREYAPGVDGAGDVDSGPIVGGLGVSASGFAIGAARAAGDRGTAEALTRLAVMVGQPYETPGGTSWRAGAALGGASLADAILFAMLTTPPRLVEAGP